MSYLRAALARIAGVFTGHRTDDDLRDGAGVCQMTDPLPADLGDGNCVPCPCHSCGTCLPP